MNSTESSLPVSEPDRIKPVADQRPAISVVVCTRNRGGSVVETITSVFASEHPNFELLVVDQSVDSGTCDAIQPFLSDPRFRYIRTPTVGKGIALNIGLAEAAAEIVAYTDDDCTVSPHWLTALERLFLNHPRVALIFSSVKAGPYNKNEGVIPEVLYPKDQIVRSISPRTMTVVMGAGMALRKSAIQALGGFEENIGPGTRFQSGDDIDLAMRTLSKHWEVYQQSEAMITHYGYRTYEQFSQVIARNYYGAGAIHAKFFKTYDLQIIPFILNTLLNRCVFIPLISSIKKRKPEGFRRLIYYLKGFVHGLRTPVDKSCLVYHILPKERVGGNGYRKNTQS